MRGDRKLSLARYRDNKACELQTIGNKSEMLGYEGRVGKCIVL